MSDILRQDSADDETALNSMIIDDPTAICTTQDSSRCTLDDGTTYNVDATPTVKHIYGFGGDDVVGDSFGHMLTDLQFENDMTEQDYRDKIMQRSR